jgi:hypothetical protein
MYAQELYLLQVKSTPSRYGISMTSTQSTQAPYTNTPNTQNGPKTHADPPTPPSQSPNATFAYTNDILRCFERSTVSSGLLEAKAEFCDRRPGFVWGGTELADGAIYTKPIGCRSAGTGTEWIRAALSPHANATERRALTRYCYRRCWAIWRLPFLGLRVEQDHLPCGLICCAVLWRLSTRVQVQVA